MIILGEKCRGENEYRMRVDLEKQRGKMLLKR